MVTTAICVGFLLCPILTSVSSTALQDDHDTPLMNLWPASPPGPPAVVSGPEADTTDDSSALVAGERVIRTGNVAVPQMQVFLPEPGTATGAACVVCPGGGFSILAWDLEGTEVATWLNRAGIAAIVVKYRVPTRQHGWPESAEGPVMDTQRALCITRQHAADWKIDPDRIGVLGFSAGGVTAALTAVRNGQRKYQRQDAADDMPCHADFAILIYPGYVADPETGELRPEFQPLDQLPPVLMIHAADDPVSCNNSIALFQAARAAGRSAEMHIYNSGGHGYGLRRTEQGVTSWPGRATGWLRDIGIIAADRKSPAASAK
jgi:acetyl esterase/lipase